MTSAQPVTNHHRNLYIDGQWSPSSGTASIDVLSASTEEVIGSVPEGTPTDVDRAARAARAAFDAWSRTTVEERAAWLTKQAGGRRGRAQRGSDRIRGWVW